MKCCGSCVFWTPNRPELTDQPESFCLKHGLVTREKMGCEDHVASTATEVNVPQHTANGTMEYRNERPVNAPVEILIVTYAKDFPWLEYCLAAIRRHCTGFQGITVAHPNHEGGLFLQLVRRFSVRLHGYDEIPGRGFLGHEIKIAEADVIVPRETGYVLHLDSDCIFHTPTTPEDYFYDDKPQYVIRSWESLTTEDPRNPRTKVVSDCLQWRTPTHVQLGFDAPAYTMTRHPSVFPVQFYPRYREWISAHHRRPFEQWMLDGKQNSHPQDRMDFTAMGGFALKMMPEKFHWIDISEGNHLAPKDRQKAYWSHGGITPEIRTEIEGFLK